MHVNAKSDIIIHHYGIILASLLRCTLQNRIRQISIGKFGPLQGEIISSVSEINIETSVGKDVRGEVTIKSHDGSRIKGIASSTEPRLECLNVGFEGEEIHVGYHLHTESFVKGDEVEGQLAFITDHGEFAIPFSIKIIELFILSTIGKVTNIDDFTRLYELAPHEAYKLFYTKPFQELLSDNMQKLYYRGLSTGTMNYNNIEEFLVALGKKSPVYYSVEIIGCPDYVIIEPVTGRLIIKKDNWGYLDLAISADQPGISFEKRHLSIDDFIGREAQVIYHIDPSKLHMGRNYIRITVDSGFHRENIEICLLGSAIAFKNVSYRKQKAMAELTRAYVEYRLRRRITGEWAQTAIECLESLATLEPDNYWYPLMKAQVYITNRQRQEALWILRDLKGTKSDDAQWAYYLYLSTLVEKERTYVDRLTNEIESILRKNPEDARIFWMLTFLKQEYTEDAGAKFKAIRHWIENGHHSPFLYVEAYLLLWQNPSLLTSLDDYFIFLMKWARRYGVMTLDLVIQFQNLVSVERSFNHNVYDILVSAYRAYGTEDLLRCICSYLIKFNKFGPRYLEIFRLGIESAFPISGLYEAYLASLDRMAITDIPHTLAMYYGFDDHLPKELKSVLYANVVIGKDKEPGIYEQYSRTIELYAMDRIKAGEIDENLAILYEDLLKKGMVDEDISRDLAKGMLTYKLPVLDSQVIRAYVYEAPYTDPQIVPVRDRCCYFTISSKEFCIILEDGQGHRFARPEPELERLLPWDNILMKLARLSKDSLLYSIWYTEQKSRWTSFERDDLSYFETILNNPKVSSAYIATVYPMMLRFLEGHNMEEPLDVYLAHGVDLDCFSQKDRCYVMELLIDNHQFEPAYDGILTYGIGNIPAGKLLILLAYEIDMLEMEYDENLMSLCMQVYNMGMHNSALISYMALHFQGSVSDMSVLWHLGKSYEVETATLADRIITCSLFSGQAIEDAFDIFGDYLTGRPSGLTVEAFLGFYSNEFLQCRIGYDALFFKYLMQYVDQQLIEVCRMALLKCLSYQEGLTGSRLEMADSLLYEFLTRGIYFAFYKNLDIAILERYHLYDKTFVEYYGEPSEHVVIHFTEDGKWTEEDMQEMYDGIYVKQFVLFFGEEKEYYITISGADGETPQENKRIYCQDILEKKSLNRFDRLNRIAMNLILENRDELQSELSEYDGLEAACSRIFTLL